MCTCFFNCNTCTLALLKIDSSACVWYMYEIISNHKTYMYSVVNNYVYNVYMFVNNRYFQDK